MSFAFLAMVPFTPPTSTWLDFTPSSLYLRSLWLPEGSIPFLAAAASLISRNSFSESGVCCALRPAFADTSWSMRKQWRIVVAEKEKTERNTLASRYAINTMMITGKIGE